VPHVSSAPLFAVFCWLYRHEEHFSTLVVRSSRVKNLNLSLEFHPPACVLIPTLSRSKAASLLTSLPTPDPVPYDATCFKLPHTLAKTHGISLLLPFSTISIRYPKTSNSAPTQGANGPSSQPTFRTPCGSALTPINSGLPLNPPSRLLVLGTSSSSTPAHRVPKFIPSSCTRDYRYWHGTTAFQRSTAFNASFTVTDIRSLRHDVRSELHTSLDRQATCPPSTVDIPYPDDAVLEYTTRFQTIQPP
jgi:hypothetical protein